MSLPTRTQTCLRSLHHSAALLSKAQTSRNKYCQAVSDTTLLTRWSPQAQSATQARSFHHSIIRRAAPKSRDRGPPSKEDTQTDFQAMDIFTNTQAPTTAIHACLDDGFALDSGLKVVGSGVLLIGGEAFRWQPWIKHNQEVGVSGGEAVRDTTQRASNLKYKIQNAKGQFDVDKHAWGVLDLIWPKPDLLVLGTGRSTIPLSPETRRDINALGIRIEVQDTRNAAAQFNLLATERGVQQVAAALVPIGWREGS